MSNETEGKSMRARAQVLHIEDLVLTPNNHMII